MNNGFQKGSDSFRNKLREDPDLVFAVRKDDSLEYTDTKADLVDKAIFVLFMILLVVSMALD